MDHIVHILSPYHVPIPAKNSLYVAKKVNCRVKAEHLLVQCVLVLSISQLLLIFLMICGLYGCSNLNVYWLLIRENLNYWHNRFCFHLLLFLVLYFFCDWWNNMHFDLGTFRYNLLTLNQIDILHNSLFIKLLFMPLFVGVVTIRANTG